MGSLHDFPQGGRIRVLTVDGGVTVIAEDRSDVDVEPQHTNVKLVEDHVLEIKSRSKNMTIHCPVGSNVSVGSVSGSVSLQGQFGSLKISAISGSVQIDRTSGDADVRSISGGITVRACGGSCKLGTKSGSIRVGNVSGEIRASTISGPIEVTTDGDGEVSLKAVSATMTVNIPPEKRPRIQLKSLSGRIKSDCEQGSDFDIKGKSISGSLHVKAR